MMNMNGCNILVDSANSLSVNIASRPNIHVLLVEPESGDHDNITNLLNYFSYKVTSVKLVSTALAILWKGKVEFDLVMMNMNSPDPLGFRLLEEANKMKLLVILMSNEVDDVTTMRALEQGAFFCIRKPLSMDILGSLWQFVLSKKELRARETEPFKKMRDDEQYVQETKELEDYVLESNQNYNNNSEEKHKSEMSSNSGGSGNYRVGYKRKVWTEWTLDLHQKFMAAARYLGEGRCYPKDILEIMNVPGLTRMQVASHLQKCRNYKWLPPNERKPKVAICRDKTPKKNIVITKPPREKRMRFGLMPFGQHESSNILQTFQEFQDAINHQDLPINPPPRTTVFDHESSNTPPLLDHAFYHDNVGLVNGQFSCGDYQQYVAPNPNLLPNLNTEAPLTILDSETVGDLLDFRQQIEMDFDAEWESFIREGAEHNQVSAVADANHQWFSDAFGPAVENKETEEDNLRKMG